MPRTVHVKRDKKENKGMTSTICEEHSGLDDVVEKVSDEIFLSIKDKILRDSSLENENSSEIDSKLKQFDKAVECIDEDFLMVMQDENYWLNENNTLMQQDVYDQNQTKYDLEQANNHFLDHNMCDDIFDNKSHFLDDEALEDVCDFLISDSNVDAVIDQENVDQEPKVDDISKDGSKSLEKGELIKENSLALPISCKSSYETIKDEEGEKICEQETEQKDQQRKSIKREESPSSGHYFDCSKLSDEEALAILNLPKRPVQNSFPKTLHLILERSELDGYSSVISWAKHGRAFRIENKQSFVTAVMPTYFFQTKMASFIRQLGTYGFHKIVGSNNEDVNYFWHSMFLRGRPGLCVGILRQKKRLLIDPTNEPDFSLLDDVPDSSKLSSKKEEEVESNDVPRLIKYERPSKSQNMQTASNNNQLSVLKCLPPISVVSSTKEGRNKNRIIPQIRPFLSTAQTMPLAQKGPQKNMSYLQKMKQRHAKTYYQNRQSEQNVTTINSALFNGKNNILNAHPQSKKNQFKGISQASYIKSEVAYLLQDRLPDEVTSQK